MVPPCRINERSILAGTHLQVAYLWKETKTNQIYPLDLFVPKTSLLLPFGRLPFFFSILGAGTDGETFSALRRPCKDSKLLATVRLLDFRTFFSNSDGHSGAVLTEASRIPIVGNKIRSASSDCQKTRFSPRFLTFGSSSRSDNLQISFISGALFRTGYVQFPVPSTSNAPCEAGGQRPRGQGVKGIFSGWGLPVALLKAMGGWSLVPAFRLLSSRDRGGRVWGCLRRLR